MKCRCIKQYDSMDCAAACLASIAWYYGKKIPILEIREALETSQEGTSVWDVCRISEKLGLFASAYKKNIDFKEKELEVPGVAHVYQEDGLAHFIIIYKIKKKNGKYRTIYEPNSLLKHIQRQILVKILDNKAISKYAKAYHKGINLKDNAIPHLNKELILKLDIKDFFENISFIDVYNSCFSIEYFPKSVGMILTYLCTYDDYLMQGAPTSAYISNLVMKEFDEVLGLWCEENNISYTRYSDDMTFSGEFNPREVIVKVRKMLYKLELELNDKSKMFSEIYC